MSDAPEARRGTRPADDRYRIRRFDADRKDEVLTFEEAVSTRPTERQLLWIDLTGAITAEDTQRLGEGLSIEARTRRELEAQADAPHLGIHGEYVHVRVAAEPDKGGEGHVQWLDIVAAQNVVMTSHRSPVGFLDNIDERIKSDTTFGRLTSATFMASLLDAAITSYHRAVDGIEEDVDRLDARSLLEGDRRDLLPDLVALRRRIARLRRLLAGHRELFASIASPDIGSFATDPESVAALQAASSRFAGAISAVEDSREVLLGSFDVYMARTAQRTNEVMKLLALATVLLLPGSLVAGLLGMNVTIPLSKDDPMSFWIVTVGVGLFALAIVVIARTRRWL